MSVKRSTRRIGLATILLIAGSVVLQHDRAVGAGDTRTISLHHVHTKEDLTITYKKNGQYDADALKKINWIMRDWRKNEAVEMDPQEIDLLWEVQREVGAKEAIHIICGYRAPDTNAMLRRRSKGVARFSQHTLGKAIDFYIPGVPLDQLRATAMKLQGGGVGYYPTSGSPFVHIDVGNVRAWPRMTREQLVKLFPNGRTVHVPSDGTPLPGYQLALADMERGHRSAAPVQKKSFLASLFGRDKDTEEVDDNNAVRAAPAPRIVTAAAKPAAPARTVLASAAPSAPAAEAAPVPLPHKRPMYQVASAESRPAPAPAPRTAGQINLASLSPNEIINMRGLWGGLSDAPTMAALPSDEATSEVSSARRTLASSMLASGRNVGPFDGADRVPADVALAYAAPDRADKFADRVAALQETPAPVMAKLAGASASIASKPAVPVASQRVARTDEKFNDPWLRGLMLVGSVQNSLVVTRVGDVDVTTLAQHMRKPSSSVVMTFSSDPHLGTTTESFTGSAVVFQSTVTFSVTGHRTASLQ